MSRELVYQFVRKRLLAGEPPTIRKVQESVGFQAVQTARDRLHHLVEEGRLIKRERVSRGYRLPFDPEVPLTYHVPVLGRVQAGDPILAVEDIETYIPVQSRYPLEELFALRVQGESMIGAGTRRCAPTATPSTSPQHNAVGCRAAHRPVSPSPSSPAPRSTAAAE